MEFSITALRRRAGLLMVMLVSAIVFGSSWPAVGGSAQAAATPDRVTSAGLAICADGANPGAWTADGATDPTRDPSTSSDDDEGNDGPVAVVTVLPRVCPGARTVGAIDAPDVHRVGTAFAASRGLRAPPQ